jgi:hypothetical protein
LQRSINEARKHLGQCAAAQAAERGAEPPIKARRLQARQRQRRRLTIEPFVRRNAERRKEL